LNQKEASSRNILHFSTEVFSKLKNPSLKTEKVTSSIKRKKKKLKNECEVHFHASKKSIFRIVIFFYIYFSEKMVLILHNF